MNLNKHKVLHHPLWWFPWSGLAVVWSCLFYPSWLAKDASMSRYQEWTSYTAVSGPWTREAVSVSGPACSL